VVRVHAGPLEESRQGAVDSRQYHWQRDRAYPNEPRWKDTVKGRQRKPTAYLIKGGLAQLARAPALQAGGHRFDSDILHDKGERKKIKNHEPVGFVRSLKKGTLPR
jgi:hypothetical protein